MIGLFYRNGENMFLQEVSKKVCRHEDIMVVARDPLRFRCRRLVAECELVNNDGQLNVWISGGTAEDRKLFEKILLDAIDDTNEARKKLKVLFKDARKRR